MAIQDGTVLVFGVTDALKTYGLVQSYDIEDRIQRATSIAPDGNVVSIQEYKYEESLLLTYLPLSAASTDDPEIGVAFEFDGATWQVDRIADRRVVDGFAQVTVEASHYPGIH